MTSLSEVDPQSPGGQLRAARERRGETINEVAFALKLNPRQVVALEENDFDALPGMALVRGFMRNYARHLGIDAAPLLEGVQQMVGRGAVDLSPIRNAEGDMPSGAARRRSTRWSGWLVAVLIAVVLAGWYFDWFRTEPVQREELQPSASPFAGTSTVLAPPRAQREPMREAPPPAVVAPVPPAAPVSAAPPAAEEAAAMPSPVESAAPAAAAAATTPADAAPGAPASEAAAAPVVEAETGETAGSTAMPAAAEGLSQLAFSFRGESWVEVREAGGRIVYSGTNRPGTTRTVQGKAPFALVVGNAAQVGLEHDGKPVNLAAHTKVSVARFNLP